jgi:hypothetical protein
MKTEREPFPSLLVVVVEICRTTREMSLFFFKKKNTIHPIHGHFLYVTHEYHSALYISKYITYHHNALINKNKVAGETCFQKRGTGIDRDPSTPHNIYGV